MATSSARGTSLFKRRVIPWQDPAVRAAIGEELRRARESQGQTLVDVAKATGNTPVEWLQAVEAGRLPPIEREYLNTVAAYAQHVGFDLTQFEVGQWQKERLAIAALVLLGVAAVAGVTAVTGGLLTIGSTQTTTAVGVAVSQSTTPDTPTDASQSAPELAPTESPTELPTESSTESSTEPPTEPPTIQPTVQQTVDSGPTATLAATSTSLPTSPTALPTASAGSTTTVQVAANPIDLADYVYIPPGPAMIGLPPTQTDQPANESPPSEVTLDGYWLKRTEVTNSEYARCVQAGACTAPANHVWEDEKYHNYPVANVTWAQANDYARWIGGRLPSEAEWEKGCRGPGGFVFPWGNAAPDMDYANYGDYKGRLTPVGFYPPKYASPYGLADMAGNVWEWTSSLEMPYPYRADSRRDDLQAEGPRVQRGGSYHSKYRDIRCTQRSGVDPTWQYDNIGFRVVWSNPEAGTMNTGSEENHDGA